MSLRLAPGEILALAGRSGSGKTTLLKCIYGLEDLEAGSITLNNEAVLGPAWNLIPGHHGMRLVSQDFYVLENHTVEENIFDKLAGLHDAEKRARARKLLKLLELAPLGGVRTRDLSSGQRQRVAIARALAIMPEVLLLDEPFSNLDRMLAEKIFAFIRAEVTSRKTAAILVTHTGEEALKYADRIAVMEAGRVVQQGNTWHVYYHPRNSRLAGLLGHYNLLGASGDAASGKGGAKRRTFFRPDQLTMGKPGAGSFAVTVTGCVYNGKCYEIACATAGGNRLVVYASQPAEAGTESIVSINTGMSAPRLVAAEPAAS